MMEESAKLSLTLDKSSDYYNIQTFNDNFSKIDDFAANVDDALGNKANSAHTHGDATTTAAGFMSSADKNKVDNLPANTVSQLNEKAAKSTAVNVTLPASWAGSAAPYTLTVTVPGATATNHAQIDVQGPATKAQVDAFDYAQIVSPSQTTNSVTLRAWEIKPTIAIPVTFLLVG